MLKFANLSMSSLGVFSDECSTFLDMMNDIGIDKKQQLCIIKKMINIAIRAIYYIFCCRNRNWDSPDFFLTFFAILIFFSFLSLSLFFFYIIQSQAAFVKCLQVARFTILHSKTQIKFPLLLLWLIDTQPSFRFVCSPPLFIPLCVHIIVLHSNFQGLSQHLFETQLTEVRNGYETRQNYFFLCFCTPDGAQRLIAFLIFRSY